MRQIKDLEDKCFRKVYVLDSPIAGKGVFADEFVKKGEIIFMLGGTISFFDKRYNGDFLRSTCVGITENILLGELSSSKKEITDFINHSCDPNSGLLDAITIIAIKDIEKGSEITIDYSFWEGDEAWVMKSPCNCGNVNCRKNITGKDWKFISTRSPLFEFYSPYIKRRIIQHDEQKT